MRNIFFTFFTFIICSQIILINPVSANDGWATSLELKGGSIYSQTEHPSISLIEEKISFDNTGMCTVDFLFKNNSKQEVDLTAGFPIMTKMKLRYYQKENKIIIVDTGPSGSKNFAFDLFSLIYKNKNNIVNLKNKEYSIRGTFLQLKDPNLLKLKHFFTVDEFKKYFSDQFINHVSINQNNSGIKIDKVLLEVKLLKTDKIEKNGRVFYLLPVFHVIHTLKFQALSRSKIQFQYR
ncbi:MAG: hypothetical protein GY754_34960, partial [bacterium]|nr:hypothetical protein [bacterium]